MRYGHFETWQFFFVFVNLGPIDFQLGLPLNINENDGRNKLGVHISKNVAEMANFRPKKGQDATFAPTLNRHNSAIFHPILTSDHTKMTSSARQIECRLKLSSISEFKLLRFCFLVYFLLQGLTWTALSLWTQNHSQFVGTCPGHGPQLLAQKQSSESFGPEPPPPP